MFKELLSLHDQLFYSRIGVFLTHRNIDFFVIKGVSLVLNTQSMPMRDVIKLKNDLKMI